MTRKLFVTTALPYANAPFHIGHMMEYIQADIWVRFQRMQGHEVHFVCADDAHGAPIMIAAEKAGKTPQEFVAEIAAGRKQYLDGFHIGFDNWHSTDGPENHALAQDIYRALRKPGPDRRAHDRAVLRPGQGHVPARPLHQGRVPEVRREGPVRRHLRGLRRGLRAHRAEEPVLDADRRDAGAEEQRALLLPALVRQRCIDFLQQWTHDARPPAARGAEQDHASGSPPTSTATSAWPTGTSAATRPTSASRSPTRRASTSTSGSTRRSATWPR